MTTLYLHLSQESLRIFENVFSLERDIAIPDNTQQLNLWTTVYFFVEVRNFDQLDIKRTIS